MPRWRKRREPAVQDWRPREAHRGVMPSTTQSSFASGKTIDRLLPPSSSETGTTQSEAARMLSLPTSVDPVNEELAYHRVAGERGAAFLAESGQHGEWRRAEGAPGTPPREAARRMVHPLPPSRRDRLPTLRNFSRIA